MALYAISITVVVILAATVGPFQESFQLWTNSRVLEMKYKESEREREKLNTEKDHLLETVKNLQTDWTAGQETIRTLRELVDNPENEKKLLEANRLAEKLSQERSVLIAKLNDVREEIQACINRKPTAKDTKPVGRSAPDTGGAGGAVQ